MNRLVVTALMVFGIVLGSPDIGFGADGTIAKVLPHLLDRKGRHTLYPSLFERDAYQSHLRKTPKKQSGIRFDIRWKATGSSSTPLKLKVALRGSEAYRTTPYVLTKEVDSKGRLGTWSALTLTGKPFKKMGKLMAWKVTLSHGETQLDEQTSFLWADIIASKQEEAASGDQLKEQEDQNGESATDNRQ